MSTVSNPAQARVYPMSAPSDDRRFTLGLVFAVVQVLIDAGYPPITAGGDLVALQQALYGFLYLPKPSRTVGESRDGIAATALSALVTIGMLDDEVADALISLWDRVDRLTPIELDAIRAAVAEPHPSDDGGLAERFLERQRQQRLAAKLAAEAGDGEPAVLDAVDQLDGAR